MASNRSSFFLPKLVRWSNCIPRAGDEIVERVRCARSVPGVCTAKSSNRNFLADDRREICPHQCPCTPLHNLIQLGNWRDHLTTLLYARRCKVTTFVTSTLLSALAQPASVKNVTVANRPSSCALGRLPHTPTRKAGRAAADAQIITNCSLSTRP